MQSQLCVATLLHASSCWALQASPGAVISRLLSELHTCLHACVHLRAESLHQCQAGETIGASYKLEYGEDRIEMHKGHVTAGQRVVLIDDLIATGGTLGAGITLMQQVRLMGTTGCCTRGMCTAHA